MARNGSLLSTLYKERSNSWQLQKILAVERDADAIFEALDVLGQDDTVKLDATAYTIGISACAKVAQTQRACKLLKASLRAKVEADVICFNAAISACDKGEKWQEAFRLCLVFRAHLWGRSFCVFVSSSGVEIICFLRFDEFSRLKGSWGSASKIRSSGAKELLRIPVSPPLAAPRLDEMLHSKLEANVRSFSGAISSCTNVAWQLAVAGSWKTYFPFFHVKMFKAWHWRQYLKYLLSSFWILMHASPFLIDLNSFWQ